MSVPRGVDGIPLPQTCHFPVPDHALEDPDPQQCRKRLEEAEVRQVVTETGEGSLGIVALPPPQLLEEGCAPRDPADCGPTPQILVNGGRGHGAAKAGQEEVMPPAEGMEAAPVPVATESSLGNGCQRGTGGEKALETCGTGRSEPELMAGAKVREVKTERGTIFPIVVDDEERKEKPVGEEVETVEEPRAVNVVKDEAGPRALNEGLHVNPLEAIQLELDALNAQADRAFLQLERRFGRMRRHYLQRRYRIIQNIPGFWMTAFQNHPQLSALIRGRDAEMFRYLTNLEVKGLRHPRMGCKFKFFFRRNPYFRNKLIVKEYEVRPSGQVVALATPIIWHPGRDPPAFNPRNQDLTCSLFAWLSDHSFPDSDRIAKIIKEDLWPNPLQYYLLHEGAQRGRLHQIRELVESPRPCGFQSG
uniref:Testis-specific Y-encoded-like protein 6 n=1 Tax=Camelus bactrianus TaxID=9837 RepID=A0A9W3GQP9_CAMBA|nr:testis-specific Y-encoded-like protein 6 [Camelus bactrianus]